MSIIQDVILKFWGLQTRTKKHDELCNLEPVVDEQESPEQGFPVSHHSSFLATNMPPNVELGKDAHNFSFPLSGANPYTYTVFLTSLHAHSHQQGWHSRSYSLFIGKETNHVS